MTAQHPRIDSDQLRILSQTCAYIAVKTPIGDHSIGTAFHIGEGYYVTARHVLERNTILEIVPFNGTYLKVSELTNPADCSRYTITRGDETFQAYRLNQGQIELEREPLHHPDPRIDVTILHVKGIDDNTPVVKLPPFIDEAASGLDFVLAKAVIFGYPPIPWSVRPDLVVATAEINAVIDTRLDRYVRFVLSTGPRGGFSGGPAFVEYGYFGLGVITESLERESSTKETGFMAVLSADTIRDCMEHHKVLPKCQIFEIDGPS